MYRLFFLAFLFFLCTAGFAQKSEKNDMIVSLREETLNKMLKAVGEVKGSSEYSVAFLKGTYHWFLKDAKITLIPDSAKFIANATVKIGSFEYTDKVNGKVAVNYNEATNQIAVQIVDAVFEIYTEILGVHMSVKKIQLADYFVAPFIFEGPMTMNSDMEFTMPDNTKKVIQARPKKCDIKIGYKEILVCTEIDFVDKTTKK